jgi:hypothetical protein
MRSPVLDTKSRAVGIPGPVSQVCTTNRREGNSLARVTAIAGDCVPICN